MTGAAAGNYYEILAALDLGFGRGGSQGRAENHGRDKQRQA
jgi:hypothetical protein